FVHRHTTSGESHLIGEVDYVQAQYANLAGRRSRGIDYSLHYRFDLGPGQYRLSLNGTRTLERRVIAERGTRGNDDAGPFQFPDFRGTMLNRYDVDQFSFGLTTRYISKSMYEVNDQSLETREMPHVPEYWQHDLNISWFPSERYTVSLGVKNL